MTMQEVYKDINEILAQQKCNRKRIYELLLAQNKVEVGSEKVVYELIKVGLQNGLIPQNRVLKYRKKTGKLPEPFTIEQLILIWDRVQRPKLGITMWLGFFCGLRISEACNLKISDINICQKTIFIRDSKNPNRTVQGYGKDGIVPIPDIALEPIKKWLKIIEGGKWFLPSMQDSNRPIRTKTIHTQYRELLDKCGLSDPLYTVSHDQLIHGKKKKGISKNVYKYRFHTLRHTYATYLNDQGVPIDRISRLLRHESIDTTMIYAKMKDKKTTSMVNEAFSSPLIQQRAVISQAPKKSSEGADIGSVEILKRRLARGEIDLVTYKRLFAELSPENTINVIHSVQTGQN